MKYGVQQGDVLDLTAPYDVLAQVGYTQAFKVGSIIAFAETNAANGLAIEGRVRGVATAAKASGAAWSVGDALYWDDTAKNFTKTSSGNHLAGVAVSAQLSADTTGNVLLVPTIP